MSLPVENLTCSKCGIECETNWRRPAATNLYYFPDGCIAPVFSKKEWCEKCQRRVDAVYIPSVREIDEFLAPIGKAIGEESSQSLQHLYLLGSQTWKGWASNRSFKGGRCYCGNATLELQKIQGDVAWEEKFVHPGCGGVLSWKESTEGLTRISWKHTEELQVIFFDAEGKLLKEGESAKTLLAQLFDRKSGGTYESSSVRNFPQPSERRHYGMHKNAFNVLGVGTRDGRKTIIERAEEQSLNLDPDSCQQARSELTNPRTRLVAELAWLPGVSPRRAELLMKLLTDDPAAIRHEDGVPALAHCNLLASAFEEVDSGYLASDVATMAEQLARLVDELEPETILRAVNEDRSVSGFPEVKGSENVSEELSARKRVYRNAIKEALNRLPPSELISAMTLLVDRTTSSGTEHAPELIDELVDSYAVETQQFLHREAENAEKLIAAVREKAKAGETGVKQIIDRLEGVLRNWDKVAQPLQLSFKARGLDHDASRSLAYKVRSLAVDLFNEHDHLEQSSRLTQLLKELFSEVPDILDRVEEDAKALGDISMRRKEASAIDPIRSLCDEVSKIADRNPSLAQHEGQRLLDEGKALLKAAPIKATSPTYVEARDLLAATVMHCAVAYGNQTSKWEPCVRLLQAAQELANDPKLKQKVRENLTIVEGNHRSLGDLEPIESAPSLYTMNGFGVTLYGKTDRNPSDGSYMATHYLVFFFVPVLPLARYRVIPTGGGYRFLGKGPLRVFDKWHIAISLGLILLMFLKG